MRKTDSGGRGGFPQALLDAMSEEELRELGLDDDGLDDFDDGMMFTTTSSSYHGQAVISDELKKAEGFLKKQKFADAFATALGTILVGGSCDYWIADTDVPEEVEKILRKMKSVWKKVLERSDAELEIDPVTRSSVIAMIKQFGKDAKDFGYSTTKLGA
jgi:hypothetical protein